MNRPRGGPASIEQPRRWDGCGRSCSATSRYALAEVYVDDCADRPLSAFHALINQARRDGGVAAVAVPTGDDLSCNAFARRELWTRLERETGLPVHVIER